MTFPSGCSRLVPLLRDPWIRGCPGAGPAVRADTEPRDRGATPAHSSSPAPTALPSGSTVLVSINWALTFLQHCLLCRCLELPQPWDRGPQSDPVPVPVQGCALSQRGPACTEPPEDPRGWSSYPGRAGRVTLLGASCSSKHILGAMPEVWKALVGQPAETHRFFFFLKKGLFIFFFSPPPLCVNIPGID